MKKKILIIGAFLGTMLITGCSKGTADITTNQMIIQKDGTIQDISVEDFSDGNYDMADLESFINQEIESYNSTAGNDKITLGSLETENKLAKLELNYESIDDYNSFNRTGYVLVDLADDTALSGNVTSVADGSSVAVSSIEDKGYKVIKVNDAMDISFVGKALYYNSNVVENDGVFTTNGEGTGIIIFK